MPTLESQIQKQHFPIQPKTKLTKSVEKGKRFVSEKEKKNKNTITATRPPFLV